MHDRVNGGIAMNRLFSGALVILFSVFILSPPTLAQEALVTDTFQTSAGDLSITFIGHASLMVKFDGKVIHIDPDSRLTDYAALPKADILLITHEHQDHCDSKARGILTSSGTMFVTNEACGKDVKNRIVMRNGDVKTVEGIEIRAVPAYNLVHMRSEGVPYHPKGVGNGYVIAFGDKKVYVAGDTENIPEMKNLKDIDIAFLPMNLPYTMTPDMTADAAKSFMPKILYPYHFGETDTSIILKLLDGSGIDVRLRNMK